MRIGFLISGLQPEAGGAFYLESSILREILEFQTNHEVYIYTFRDLDISPKANQHIVRIEPNPTIVPINKRSLIRGLASFILNKVRRSFWKRPTLNELLVQHKIDLFWFLGSYKPIPIPFVFTVLDCQHRLQPEFPEVSTTGWTWDEREDFLSNVRRASYVITGTDEGAKQISSFYQVPYERMRTIPLPVHQTYLETSSTERPKSLWINSPFLFYPAQFWPHKNQATLLYALKIINSRINEHSQTLSLVLCGSDKGNREYIFRLVRELGLESKVQMLPFVNETEVSWLYDNAFALIFPSLFGPDNLPPLEAFARRCPVLAANIPGAIEQLGEAAIFFDPLNEESIAESVLSLLQSESLKSICIERGIKQITNRTPSNYVNSMFEIINTFSKKRRLWGTNFDKISSS